MLSFSLVLSYIPLNILIPSINKLIIDTIPGKSNYLKVIFETYYIYKGTLVEMGKIK